jgi:hypothetical protein
MELTNANSSRSAKGLDESPIGGKTSKYLHVPSQGPDSFGSHSRGY